jgi:hypothetical protein
LTISSPEGIDLDFALWGPFPWYFQPTNTGVFTDSCASCPNNTDNPFFYPSGNLVDCSYSANPMEVVHISNAQLKQQFILLVSHGNLQNGNIVFNLNSASPDMAHINGAFLTIDSLTVSSCDSLTGFYTISIQHSIYTGLTCICPDTITLSDITSGWSIGANAYNEPLIVDSILADGMDHALVLNWQGVTDTIHYQAPISCKLASIADENLRAKGGICIYPNPANGMVTLKLPGFKGELDFELLNIYGVKALNSSIFVENEMNIMLNDMEPGLYTLIIKSDGIKEVFKLVLR